MSIVRLIVYSDYLCPWCYNASVRLRRLEAEMAPDLEIVWRSYLLRPEPKQRDPEKFRSYTRSWMRPAAEEDGGTFRTWTGDASPPSHSVPAHLAAKAAATLGGQAFHRMHDAILRAYFAQSRDISDESTLAAIWREQDLPPEAFDRRHDPRILQETLEDHAEAQSLGITGAPAARIEGNEAFLTGALPLVTYRRWIERQIAGKGIPATH